MANSIDPDQTPHSAASDLGLPCLQRPICPNTQGCYSSINIDSCVALTAEPGVASLNLSPDVIFMETDHEILSMVILPFQLIQEGQCLDKLMETTKSFIVVGSAS